LSLNTPTHVGKLFDRSSFKISKKWINNLFRDDICIQCSSRIEDKWFWGFDASSIITLNQLIHDRQHHDQFPFFMDFFFSNVLIVSSVLLNIITIRINRILPTEQFYKINIRIIGFNHFDEIIGNKLFKFLFDG
jgi:hypothetical protein